MNLTPRLAKKGRFSKVSGFHGAGRDAEKKFTDQPSLKNDGFFCKKHKDMVDKSSGADRGDTDYEVKLEIFEGPLDLLLHLIHKNEVDIFDIPIAAITRQYLEYIDMMRALNITVAGDFLVMASTLIHIKSKMLLPGPGEEEEEDPRLEITRPLLEYMQLKEKAQELSEREILGKDVFAIRPHTVEDPLDDEGPRLDVSLFQLMDAFKRIMDQYKPGAQLTMETNRWSVKEKAQYIIDRLKEKGALFFHELFSADRSIAELVVTFLALLDLVHASLVKAFQPSEDQAIKVVASFDRDVENTNGTPWKAP
ncbi:MAG: segregation/condensation protein A [Deltaproteobacteria bacterium]